MMSIEDAQADKLAWARSLVNEDEKKNWLEFYQRFFNTQEGIKHLEWVVAGRIPPYLR
jgi:hypothetical protein